jgi:hypothetical protein
MHVLIGTNAPKKRIGTSLVYLKVFEWVLA